MENFQRYFLKNLPVILIACIYTCFSLTGCNSTLTGNDLGQSVIFKPVDPLEKIFRETSWFNEVAPMASVARGEHGTFQWALRSSENLSSVNVSVMDFIHEKDTISGITAGFVGYVHVGRNTPSQSRDKLMPVSGFYPDPIVPRSNLDIPAGVTQPIWITVKIPVNASEGIYTGKVLLTGKTGNRSFSIAREMQLKVFPVTINKTSLWVTNWYSTSPHNLELVFGEKNLKPFSDRYWQFVTLLAEKMAEYRQNVALISPLQLADYRMDSEGKYSIDFTRFDKTVEIFIREGVVGRIEGGHIGGRSGGWISDFVVSVPVVQGDSTLFKPMSITKDSARTFYTTFIPALTQHLKDKGWDGIYMQHLADEPIPENVKSYIEIAGFVEKYAPDLKIVEACHSKDVNNAVDIWVPQLDFMHLDYDFYKQRAEKGDEIWFYTCLNPKGEYANRFIELPLIKTRILHWINFRYNIPGYLHWGLDFWKDDPFRETTSIQLESGTILPGGDAWIVYPGDSAIYSSIRLEAMRDGIVDYELLKMLSLRFPDEAAEMARQVVYRFDYYDIDIEAFREKRRRILEMLSTGKIQ